jgi:hypothetical protein
LDRSTLDVAMARRTFATWKLLNAQTSVASLWAVLRHASVPEVKEKTSP